jgi:hypothetical protein
MRQRLLRLESICMHRGNGIKQDFAANHRTDHGGEGDTMQLGRSGSKVGNSFASVLRRQLLDDIQL